MNRISFDGRVAIVTGAGGGLGREYALDLARRGASVVVNDLGTSPRGEGSSRNVADRVVEEIRSAGGKAIASYDSVATAAGGEAIVAAAMKAYDRVDVLINNAGTMVYTPFEELPDSVLDAMVQVHLNGAFYVTRPAFRIMKQQRYGRIIFVSSGCGIFGNDEGSAYGAAKAGLVGLMNVLSQEGKAYGVLCNALLPTAASRLSECMPESQLTRVGEMFSEAGQFVGSTGEPAFVTPLAVYLASEACTSTHAMYSATLGRYARVFIAASQGWIGPRDKPPSAEDINLHFAEITNRDNLIVPDSMMDEFVHIIDHARQAG